MKNDYFNQLLFPVLCALFAQGYPAKAALDETVNGVTYSISILTGSFDSLSAQLEASPFWGHGILADEILADTLAVDVGYQLGHQTGSTDFRDGPYFAWNFTGGDAVVGYYYPANSPYYYQNTGVDPTATYLYADVTAVAVPEASTWFAGALLLLPLGMSTLRLLRKGQSG